MIVITNEPKPNVQDVKDVNTGTPVKHGGSYFIVGFREGDCNPYLTNLETGKITIAGQNCKVETIRAKVVEEC